MDPVKKRVLIGCAGWKVSPEYRSANKPHHLSDYARYFNCAEINSTFHRTHRTSTFTGWAALVPDEFRFALKIPRAISHDTVFADPSLIDPLMEGVEALEGKCGSLLIQTAPKTIFPASDFKAFVKYLRKRFDGAVCVEPRHDSWLKKSVRQYFSDNGLTLVFPDPQKIPIDRPDASSGTTYLRLHGSPRIYYSSYADERLEEFAQLLKRARNPTHWVIFDNTAHGHAFTDALKLKQLLAL